MWAGERWFSLSRAQEEQRRGPFVRCSEGFTRQLKCCVWLQRALGWLQCSCAGAGGEPRSSGGSAVPVPPGSHPAAAQHGSLSLSRCDADPSALANYVVALVKKDKPEKELKAFCADQLDVFLQKGVLPGGGGRVRHHCCLQNLSSRDYFLQRLEE